jgi:hypothetical protein
MPASFVIDHQQKLVRSKGWGVLVEDDLATTQRGLHDDRQFEPMYRQVWDFTEVTEMKVTAKAIRRLALTSPFAPLARRAIVVNSDVAHGMARMYALMGDRDPNDFRIFRDMSLALSWLGVKP